MEPFYAAARLLYEGPWVAERYLTARALIASSPEAVSAGDAANHPRRRARHGGRCLRGVLSARRISRACATYISGIDALVLPTAPTIYTVEQVRGRSDWTQQPARHLHQFRQSARSVRACRAGLDACAMASRLALRLLAPAGEDAALAAIGREFHHATGSAARRARLTAAAVCRPHGRGGRRRNCHRGRRRASLRHAAERRVARGRRPHGRVRHDRAALSSLRARRHQAGKARSACG